MSLRWPWPRLSPWRAGNHPKHAYALELLHSLTYTMTCSGRSAVPLPTACRHPDPHQLCYKTGLPPLLGAGLLKSSLADPTCRITLCFPTSPGQVLGYSLAFPGAFLL